MISAAVSPYSRYTRSSISRTKRRELEATAAPLPNILRETLKHAAEVFQVSPIAAGYRALKLKLIVRGELQQAFPNG